MVAEQARQLLMRQAKRRPDYALGAPKDDGDNWYFLTHKIPRESCDAMREFGSIETDVGAGNGAFDRRFDSRNQSRRFVQR